MNRENIPTPEPTPLSREEQQERMVKEALSIFIRFARVVAEKTGKSLEETLLRNTPLYRRFGLRGDRNPENRVWKEYIAGIHSMPLEEWTEQFYDRRKAELANQESSPESPEEEFGCFKYTIEGTRANLHFVNKDSDPRGPLSKERAEARKGELERLFSHIQENHPEITTIEGGSWLLNRKEELKRFLPHTFVDSGIPNEREDFSGLGIWGQFMNSEGKINYDLVEKLFEKLRDTDPEHLSKAFPYQLLIAEAPIELFYKEYGITPPQKKEESSASSEQS